MENNSTAKHYLAVDLGAESGRLILGTLVDGRWSMEEIQRMPNGPITGPDGTLTWDLKGIFDGVLKGLVKVAAKNVAVRSIACDAWGVDYALLDGSGEVLDPVHHYRDARCPKGAESLLKRVSWEEIFAATGLQYMPINTLFQLETEPEERLKQSSVFLTIGDLFNYWLCGVGKIDISSASTTQMFDPRTLKWADSLIERAGFPRAIFPEVVPCGTRLGTLQPELAAQTGLSPELQVLATCSHDTGAAVAATPVEPGANWAYLSSGTWSLMGVERSQSIINDTCRELNFTNELGLENSVRLLKNIIGLWIVQELKREWDAEGRPLSYSELVDLAESAEPFRSLINPNDPRFVSPGDMSHRIVEYCRETSQPAPETPGQFVRCALESLALLYRVTIQQLEQLTESPIDRLHIFGGGCQNRALNQWTANATGIPVYAGPVEATALGNMMTQAIALGDLESWEAGRASIGRSFPVDIYRPQEFDLWKEQAEKFAQFLNQK